MSKLKIGDEILEDDGISIIVYKIVKTTPLRAIGVTEHEGKTWLTSYYRFYRHQSNIIPVRQRPITEGPVEIRLIRK